MSAPTAPDDPHAALERAQANVARLERENVRLDDELRRPRLARRWVLLPIGAMLVAATIGHLLGGAVAHREGAARAAAQDRSAWLARERSVTADCKASYERLRADLVLCADARNALPEPAAVAPPRLPCPCEPADPLCSCL